MFADEIILHSSALRNMGINTTVLHEIFKKLTLKTKHMQGDTGLCYLVSTVLNADWDFRAEMFRLPNLGSISHGGKTTAALSSSGIQMKWVLELDCSD